MKRIIKEKSKFNLSIDIIMLILIMPMAGIGFLVKYVLIPGFQRNVLHGTNSELEFWGLNRHQWGTIHLIISIVFVGLLILHIVLHWGMIVRIYRRMIPNNIFRKSLAFGLTTIGLILISFPLMIKPKLAYRAPLHQNRDNKDVSTFPGFSKNQGLYQQTDTSRLADIEVKKNERAFLKEPRAVDEYYEVNGNQTLISIADKYNLPADEIAADLNIPKTLTGERLGRLKKRYSFTMDDVRNTISSLIKEKQQ